MKLEVKQLTANGFTKEIKHITKMVKGLEDDVRNLGDETANEMKNIISQNKKRPGGQSKLENAIDSTYIYAGDQFGFFVGLLDKLYIAAPWFYFINFGVSYKGMKIPGRGKAVPLGKFAPGKGKPNAGSFGEGRWTPGKGKYSFRAKKGITPLHYIEKTAIWMDVNLNRLLAKIK